MKIKAAVARNPHETLNVEHLSLSEPNSDEVLVRIVATGVCHSDIAIIEQILPLPLPMVLGHEGAGIVEQVGSDVQGLEIGDHVVLTFNSCGTCEPCNDHHPAYCSQYPLLNFYTRRPDGSATLTDQAGETVGGAFFGQSSFATYALASQRNCIKVRQDAPLELLGPLGCGLTTGAGTVVNVLKPTAAMTVAIFGTGAVGMAALLAAKNLGVGRIVAIDRVASRLALAKELGATDVINTSDQDLSEALLVLGGIDRGVETTGVPVVIQGAVAGLKERGELVLLGASPNPEVTLNILPLISGRVIRGVVNGDCEPDKLIPQMVDWYMNGTFPFDRLVAFYGLDEINQAIADSNSGKSIKPIIKMSG